MSDTPSQTRSFRFPPRLRLSGRLAFARVFDARLRKSCGPVSILGRSNDLDHPRLGLSVSRRVGTAVVRNHIKRLLREAFRLSQHDLPAGYDLVVVVHPHPALALAEYQRLLREGAAAVALEGRRRERRQAPPGL